MNSVILYTRDRTLKLDGIKPVMEISEDIEGRVILMDIDTVGFSSLPDLREGNILIALTDRNIPGYVMKLSSLGFYEILPRRPDVKELRSVVNRALEEVGKRTGEKVVLLSPSREEELRGELCEELCSIAGGKSESIRKVLKLAGRAASADVPVLITGESGTGKELFAKAIWKLSSRWQGPFVAVNCGAIPESLLEAELFGYEKGAFTGANTPRKGLVEEADHGILFLDEIGEMPLSLQPKLLRVLQERKVRRLGSNREVPVNFRLICATNRDLKKLVREGKFREDLYYRLATIHIHIPPLRERREDIPELLNCILLKVSRETGKRVKGYTEGFLRKVLDYPWPGNVRELENVLRKSVVLSSSEVLRDVDLILDYSEEEPEGFEGALRDEVRMLLKERPGEVYRLLSETLSRVAIEEALRESRGNQVLASKLLGINRLTLRKRIASLNLRAL